MKKSFFKIRSYLPLATLFVFLLLSCSKMAITQPMNTVVPPDIPKPRHIIIVMLENHGFDQIIGSSNAPFINSLVKKGMLFTDYHGVTHPSQPNYIALFSGSTQGVTGDKCLLKETPYTSPNLGASMISAGYTFTGFAQTMPSVGFLPCFYKMSDLNKAYLYGRKHCPWVNWQGNKKNNLSRSVSLPMTFFPSDYNKLPTLAFVIPDMDHDMHNIGKMGDAYAIKTSDTWLKENLSQYADWAIKHNSLLIITFDEDNFTPQNHIPTIFVGQMVKTGTTSQHADHYDLHRTIEAMYGLTPAGTNDGNIIDGVWR